MNSKRLIIIGNSKPDKDYTPLIREGDVVVRFNKIDHFETGLIGDRTDIIVLVGNWSMRHHCYKNRMSEVRKSHFETCNQVWFRNSKFISRRRNEILRCLKLIEHPLVIIYKEEEMAILSDQKDQKPSTGFLILKKIWKQDLFPDMEKYVCCLESDYKKNLHHNIKREGNMISRWIREGKFKRL